VDFLDKNAEIYQLEKTGTNADMVLGEIGVGENKKHVLYRRPEIPDINGLKVELETFIRCIRGEKAEGVTGADGRNALAVAIDILEKMKMEG
jgi:predicted dehydrogenase